MTTHQKVTTGVVLAAGKGSRMAQLPTGLPKAVLPILGEPILYHQLRTMAELGIDKVFIVVGHLGFRVVKEIERMPDLGLDIEYVAQEQTLGIAHCVGKLEPWVDGPFMLFLGDIFFTAPRIGEMITTFSSSNADGVLGAIEEESIEAIQKNFSIVVDAEGRALRVVEKPRHPQSNLKGVGVYLFTPTVFDAIRRTPRTAMRDEYEITDSIQIMIQDGLTVIPCACIERDLNLTSPPDLLNVNLDALNERGLDHFVDPGACLGADTRVTSSVIGPGATIRDGARLEQSLVFNGATVAAGARLNRAIVTDKAIYQV